MTRPDPRRMTVALDQDPVVFLIGMRVNAWWKPWRWIPVALAMGRMLRELKAQPEAGLLGVISSGPGVMVQYWRSVEDLQRYASSRDGQHYPAWAAFNKALKDAGDVGIWHETYHVPRSRVECVYHHMPPIGLSAFSPRVEATGRRARASGRLQLAQEEGGA